MRLLVFLVILKLFLPIGAFANTNNLLESAQKNLSDKKFEEALNNLESYIKINQEDYNAYILKGKLYYEMYRYEEAAKSYEKAVSINPTLEGYLGILESTRYLYSVEDKDKIEVINKILELDNKNVEANQLMANLLVNEKKYEEALKYLDVALTQDPLNNTLIFFKKASLEALDRKRELLDFLEIVVKNNPKSALDFEEKSNVEKGLGFYKEALVSIDKSIVLSYPNSILQYKKGIILLDLENYKEAEKSFDESIKISYVSHVLFFKGLSQYLQGKYKDAIESFDKSIEIHPHHLVHYYKALCLDILNMKEESSKYYSMAFDIDNNLTFFNRLDYYNFDDPYTDYKEGYYNFVYDMFKDDLSFFNKLKHRILGVFVSYEEKILDILGLIDENNIKHLNLKARSLIDLAMYKDALSIIEKAEKIQKTVTTIFLKASAIYKNIKEDGQLYRATEDYRESTFRELLTKASEYKANDFAIILNLAISYDYFNYLDKFFENMNKAKSINPKSFIPYYYVAKMKNDMQEKETALEYAKQALELSNNVHVHRLLSEIFLVNNDLEYVKKHILEVLKYSPKDDNAIRVLGEVYMKEGKYQEAYDVMIKNFNPLHDLNNQIILSALDKMGKKREQIEILNKMIESDSMMISSRSQKASILIDLEEYENALNEVNIIEELIPNDSINLKLKYDILLKTGKEKEANDVLEKLKSAEKYIPPYG